MLSLKKYSAQPKVTIKQILISNQNWWNFYSQHKDKIRTGVVVGITKLLSCKTIIRGYRHYKCSNPECLHTKRILHTCKSRACSSCGKKATEAWIQKQNQTLPQTAWQHITFTMPSELWDFFWYNRSLLNQIALIAAHCIKKIADKKEVIPGIFVAIHTFGRDLKRNVHIHLSTTLGGLSIKTHQWKKLFFNQETLMKTWRYQIIRLFRKTYAKLKIPPQIQKLLNHTFTFNDFLNSLYQKHWVVHCNKPSDNHKDIVSYLSRYLKKPPIAESKLKHYDGNEVVFNFLDHNTKTYQKFKLSTEEFIQRFIQHIPDVGFRMIRYYGFLAHRVKTKLLPIVYAVLNQEKTITSKPPTHAELIQRNFGFDPLKCILCGHNLVLSDIQFGQASVTNLLLHHRELAILKTF
jgi:hypothetical protein